METKYLSSTVRSSCRGHFRNTRAIIHGQFHGSNSLTPPFLCGKSIITADKPTNLQPFGYLIGQPVSSRSYLIDTPLSSRRCELFGQFCVAKKTSQANQGKEEDDQERVEAYSDHLAGENIKLEVMFRVMLHEGVAEETESRGRS